MCWFYVALLTFGHITFLKYTRFDYIEAFGVWLSDSKKDVQFSEYWKRSFYQISLFYFLHHNFLRPSILSVHIVFTYAEGDRRYVYFGYSLESIAMCNIVCTTFQISRSLSLCILFFSYVAFCHLLCSIYAQVIVYFLFVCFGRNRFK